MSFVGWLDHSEEEQRRVREVLQMFRDRGTVDDLGIGTLREAISNKLFPGSSVIQTRARYFLFIPWIFQHVARSSSNTVLERAEYLERRLIGALKQSADQDGLIGRQAGMDVRTLPSAVYWAGLTTYGIFRAPGLTRSQYARRARSAGRRATPEDELAERREGFWHPDIPPPPDGFFDLEYAEFAMTPDEARWLSERILSWEATHGRCLLGDHLRQLRRRPRALPDHFWEGTLPEGAAERTQRLVHHAERFSLLVEGAAIVYNLMLHEQRDDQARGDPEAVETLRAHLAEWSGDAQIVGVPAWTAEREEFFALVDPTRRVPPPSRAFAEAVMDALATRRLDRLDRDTDFRRLIRRREVQHKRNLARFHGGPRLATWEGNSGLRRLDYRWGQVRRFLNDIRHGLENTGGSRRQRHAAH